MILLMRLCLSLFALFLLGAVAGMAQSDTNRAEQPGPAPGGSSGSTAATGGEEISSRPWYDTLTVTKPRYARVTPAEQLALSAFTALAIPIGLTVSAITVFPPSITMVIEDGIMYTGISVSTGIGFGGDRSTPIFFPDYRVQVEGAYFFSRSPAPMLRASILADHPMTSLHSRDFLWLGVAGGGGLSTDFTTVVPFAEGWIGLINPMGLRVLTLFPMHNYGLRGRAGYDLGNHRPWYELSITASSTFW